MAATADPHAGSEGFGVVIRRLRLAAGLTQEELADRSGPAVVLVTGDRDLHTYVTDGLAAAEQRVREVAAAG
jgi:hypothetical protein